VAELAFAARAWVISAIAVAIALLVGPLLPSGPAWRLTHLLCRTLLWTSGLAPRVEGGDILARSPGAMLAVNHTSYLDVLLLLSLLPTPRYRFVAKRELSQVPLLGALLKRLGTTFVERDDVRQSVDDARAIETLGHEDRALVAFPEGKLNRRPGLSAFRTGLFQAATAAGVPVIPVVIRGARSTLPDESWFPRQFPISIRFLPPVSPEGQDRAAVLRLRDQVRRQMLQHCGEPDTAID
jgi:1-acyl-sn-glycerol-3-phosphate acyltransferase